MKDNDRCASLNYEAEYHRAMDEIEKAKYEIGLLREETFNNRRELDRLLGFQQAVVLIFRGEIHD